MTSDPIDALLAHYLGLLHEYTELRRELASHQATMYGSLARANFAAERGFRYGPDHYDGRMQALARVQIADADADAGSDDAAMPPTVNFAVARTKTGTRTDASAETAETATEKEAEQDGKDGRDSKDGRYDKEDAAAPDAGAAEKPTLKKAVQKKAVQGPRDPLQWFGVLAPMALRQAQHEAIDVVDRVVPRLASLDAEMAAVEIEVRRARKKRTRAQAAAAREKPQPASGSSNEQPTVAANAAAPADSRGVAVVSV